MKTTALGIELGLIKALQPFAYICPTHIAAERARVEFESLLTLQGIIYTRSGGLIKIPTRRMLQKTQVEAYFIVSRLSGTSMPHVPVVFFEDPEKMDPIPRAEALFIAAPEDGFGPYNYVVRNGMVDPDEDVVDSITKAEAARPVCTGCNRELSSYMDAYYGRDTRGAKMCSDCRRKVKLDE